MSSMISVDISLTPKIRVHLIPVETFVIPEINMFMDI